MAKKNESESTAVAEVKTGAVALDFMSAEDFGGSGFEGTDNESFAIPFLQLLQKMSPLVDEDSASHIEGAKAGMFYNTVTGELYDGKKGVLIIPCAYRRSVIRWGGREAEVKGFKGEISIEEFEAMRADETKVVSVDGRLYEPDADGKVNPKKSDFFSDTRSHFVVIVDEETGEFSRALLSLSSSQIKASKMLMTALQQKKVKTPAGLKTPPTFANMVRLTTQGQSNEKGSWSGAVFNIEGLVTDQGIYEEAKAFYKDIVSGEVNVDYAKADAASAQGDVNEKPQDAEGF